MLSNALLSRRSTKQKPNTLALYIAARHYLCLLQTECFTGNPIQTWLINSDYEQTYRKVIEQSDKSVQLEHICR